MGKTERIDQIERTAGTIKASCSSQDHQRRELKNQNPKRRDAEKIKAS